MKIGEKIVQRIYSRILFLLLGKIIFFCLKNKLNLLQKSVTCESYTYS